MFTGIIEEIGIVKEFNKSVNNAFIKIGCEKILQDIKIGDSIAIDGICQTVIEFDKTSFSAQISSETLNITTFSTIKTNNKVNLERALTLNTRLGGHLVSGHVDGLAKLSSIQKTSDFYTLKFELPENLTKYVAKKGSVAINGISLTVADILNKTFSVAIIPHTFENTCLKNLQIGDFVNIETDILAKYVEKILSTGNNKTLDKNFLIENGFM